MAHPAAKFATYDDIRALPENLVGEIIHGALVTHPRPSPRHAVATTGLTGRIGNPFGFGEGGPGGWWILVEPELHLGGDVLVPDLAGWRRERLPKMPEAAWFELIPDWACEVLSPSTSRVGRVRKMPIYAQLGLRHLWLVDPDLRTLEAYENREGKWLLLTTLEGDAAVAVPPFDAVSFSLGTLWVD